MRALAQGWQVSWVAFYKEAGWNLAEQKLETILQPAWAACFELKLLGKGFYIKHPTRSIRANKRTIHLAPVQNALVSDDDTLESHRQAAEKALSQAQKILLRKRNRPQLLVLDEVVNAVNDQLINEGN